MIPTILIPRELISESELRDWHFIKCSEEKREKQELTKSKEDVLLPSTWKKACLNKQWQKIKNSPLN